MNRHGLPDGAKEKGYKIEEEITFCMPFHKREDTDDDVTNG